MRCSHGHAALVSEKEDEEAGGAHGKAQDRQEAARCETHRGWLSVLSLWLSLGVPTRARGRRPSCVGWPRRCCRALTWTCSSATRHIISW